MGEWLVRTDRLETLKARISPTRQRLLDHKIYRQIETVKALRLFMEAHVFAVWDFMSLLKALQKTICCVDVPWVPPADPVASRLINEIVLGEESDLDGNGSYSSHFELYRSAMQQCGADLNGIDQYLCSIRSGMGPEDALERSAAPVAVQRFVKSTFDIINSNDPCAIAASFTFGREDLLPDVFQRILATPEMSQKNEWDGFRYYLDRHIEVDGGEHGAAAEKLVVRLCVDNNARWNAAETAAIQSLEARIQLWNGVSELLDRELMVA